MISFDPSKPKKIFVDVFSFLIQTGEKIFLSHHKLNPNEIKA